MIHTLRIAARLEAEAGFPRDQAETIASAYAQAINQSSTSSTHLFDTLRCFKTLISGGLSEHQARGLTHAFQDICRQLAGR